MRGGFTLVELAAIVAVGGIVGATAMVVQPAGTKASERQQKDAQQIRGICQAFVIWSQHNKDVYPLPSMVDAADQTVKEQGEAKNTSANIMSLMVYNGMVSAELLVSPAEKNTKVVVAENYLFDQPKKAVVPANALWDPALSAELGPKEGNISYANLQPSAERLKRWSCTFMTNEVVLSTRGPQIESVVKNKDGTVTPKLARKNSIAMTLFGDGVSWSGHAAFNDNHVEFAKGKLTDGKPVGANEPKYTAKNGEQYPDIWCYDEPDDDAGANNILGLFVTAGKERKDWKGAWD